MPTAAEDNHQRASLELGVTGNDRAATAGYARARIGGMR